MGGQKGGSKWGSKMGVQNKRPKRGFKISDAGKNRGINHIKSYLGVTFEFLLNYRKLSKIIENNARNYRYR
jgi:hypothetical protein